MKSLMKHLTSRLLIIAIIFMAFWCMVSYIEIITKNASPNPTYSDTNIIVNAMNNYID